MRIYKDMHRHFHVENLFLDGPQVVSFAYMKLIFIEHPMVANISSKVARITYHIHLEFTLFSSLFDEFVWPSKHHREKQVF